MPQLLGKRWISCCHSHWSPTCIGELHRH